MMKPGIELSTLISRVLEMYQEWGLHPPDAEKIERMRAVYAEHLKYEPHRYYETKQRAWTKAYIKQKATRRAERRAILNPDHVRHRLGDANPEGE
jgi:hypothetical protein